jgi:hypothetical protein
MGGSVAFTSEALYSGDNPAIIASPQAENRLAECLPFVRRKRSLSERRAYIHPELFGKRLFRSTALPPVKMAA